MKSNTFILFLFLISLPIFAQNHFDMLSEINGEQPYSQFGHLLASLDFNADGYDDLVVEADQWKSNPDSILVGKIYFYFGKEHCFGDTADMTISGYRMPDSSLHVDHISDIGDVNNDGYEDLGYFSYTHPIKHINFLFGNSLKDSIPDKIFSLSNEEPHCFSSKLSKLGDINGDGYDDVGYMMYSSYISGIRYSYIIYGGSEEFTLRRFITLDNPDTLYTLEMMSGIGDVNNDGYDDIQIGYSYYAALYYYRNMIFFGGAEMDTIPDFVYVNPEESHDIQRNAPHGLRCGDYNGDSKDDFVLTYSNTYGEGYLYTSDENNNIQYLLTLETGIYEHASANAFAYGDINGDGKNDLIFGDDLYSYYDGRAILMLGSDNGNIDYQFNAEIMIPNETGAAVSIGDYNGDGYDDVAIAAPHLDDDFWEGVNGEVWIYAGGPNIHDTTENTDDEITPVNNMKLKVYPNPFNPSVTLSFDMNEKDVKKVEIEIYNLKGERVKTLGVRDKKLGINQILWNGKSESGKSVAAGIYVAKLLFDKKPVAYKKVTLLK